MYLLLFNNKEIVATTNRKSLIDDSIGLILEKRKKLGGTAI